MSIKLYSALMDINLNIHICQTFSSEINFTYIGNSCLSETVIDDINIFKPDILLVNDKIEDMDLPTLALMVSFKCKKVPCFIVVSANPEYSEIDAVLSKFNVFYVSPLFGFQEVENMIFNVANRKFHDFDLDATEFPCAFEKIICGYLNGFGMINDNKGYRLLIKLIKLMYKKSHLTCMDIQSLYKIIARKDDETVGRVSRMIKHTIEQGWNNRENIDPNGLYSKVYSNFKELPDIQYLITFIANEASKEYAEYIRRTKLYLKSDVDLLDDDDDYILNDD